MQLKQRISKYITGIKDQTSSVKNVTKDNAKYCIF